MSAKTRKTVQMVPQKRGEKTIHRPQGTETADANRANVFGVWQENADDEYEGAYIMANVRDAVSIELELRFAFCEGDIDDHAEVYNFTVFCWERKGRKLLCGVEFEGEWVAESGEIYGPLAIYGPLVYEAATRLRRVRWDNETFAPRLIGPSAKEK